MKNHAIISLWFLLGTYQYISGSEAMAATGEIISSVDQVLENDGSTLDDGEVAANNLAQKRQALLVREEQQLAELRNLQRQTEQANLILQELERSCAATKNCEQIITEASQKLFHVMDQLKAQEMSEVRSGQLDPSHALLMSEFEANQILRPANAHDDDNHAVASVHASQSSSSFQLYQPLPVGAVLNAQTVGQIVQREKTNKTNLQSGIGVYVGDIERLLRELKQASANSSQVIAEKRRLMDQTHENLTAINTRIQRLAKIHEGAVAQELLREIEELQDNAAQKQPPAKNSTCLLL